MEIVEGTESTPRYQPGLLCRAVVQPSRQIQQVWMCVSQRQGNNVCAAFGFYYQGVQWFLYLLSALCAESGGCPGVFQSQPGWSDLSPLLAEDRTESSF